MSFGDWRFSYFEYGPTKNHGNSQRDFGMYRATRDFLMFADDDDLYVPGALSLARRLLRTAPDRPHCFRRVSGPPVSEPWTVGGALFVPPNIPGKLGTWSLGTFCTDAYFILGTMKHYESLGILGHDIELYHVRPAGSDGPPTWEASS